jgi:hypothetical protein
MILPEDLRQLLLAFNAEAVEHLVVGGHAVGIYAEPRAAKYYHREDHVDWRLGACLSGSRPKRVGLF